MKIEEADKENTFLRGEVQDLTILLNTKFKPLPIILKHILKSACYKKTLIHKYTLSNFQTNSPKGNMSYNQNKFPNKSNSFIPQINSGLATPATSDPDLKSSIHSSHNNSETELSNKSSVVDFTIDEILTKLGSDREIHNGSILLFPPTDKQALYPSHPRAPFKPSHVICHEKEQEQRREEICTTKNLSEGFKETKLVRLVSLEDRRLPRSFNHRTSLKEIYSKISSLRRSSDIPRSDKAEAVYALSHNLNEEIIKCTILSFASLRIQ